MNNKLSESQLWALAAGDVLLSGNGYDFACAYDTERSGINAAKVNQEVLLDGWSISDHLSAWKSLRFLTVEGGHHEAFDRRRFALSVMNAQQHNQYISSFHDEMIIAELTIVQHYHGLLPAAGVLAWDLGRAAFIGHLCMEFGLIDPEEAWPFLIHNASLLQQSYASWEEFGTAYIIGRQFWAKSLDPDQTEKHLGTIIGQMQDPNSPWAILPWELKLEA
ncbi:DUF1266 domain-containing protein [Paenibacillus chibensis]|uniref:DUF1266 domain-containing protein n=1 Tax=Paenibacillus chibensis TaxID=59846 RepID=UPI000FDC1F0F|nr:DUF1266 domain-containing protein [Paenibacillus chibensis]MEC0372199.1 DUF1266 domain-containing protein [Paenibacillus chibensis]